MMLERSGKIIAIHADRIEVKVDTPSACGHCGSRQSCHGTDPARVTLPLEPGMHTGDAITLGMEESTVNLSALLAYLLPALSLIAGAWLGDSLSAKDADLFAIVGAALGLCIGVAAAWCLSKLLRHTQQFPVVNSCASQIPSTHQQSHLS
ncbi:SoxR reducing system RseC family protein [Uliginosibacterium gangwonense]|uniref:SoxR reducing system RseC family protein n=1 Tax=Uliginosibacterium gangwonense TaxID=392736 RepID=UPI00037A7B45|nr:SoxR reducing system RseC family protein [Uliginosibacterium gangwonense]